jgi:hypothetical protein
MSDEFSSLVARDHVPVKVINWDEKKEPKPEIVKTTVKTYVLDATGAVGPKNVQVCDYEPRRVRLEIVAIDQDITVTTDVPVASPDTSSVTVAPQGRHVPKIPAYPFITNGSDAFWINSLTATTRVTVTREFK